MPTAVIFTFTFANALLAFLNLLPFTTRQGVQSDGKILLRLCRDNLLGRTYVAPSFAGMKSKESAPIFAPETSLLSIKSLVPPVFTQGLEILSDPVTPLPFVVEMFVKHLHWDNSTALSRAIEIHNRGGLLLDRTSLEEARRVADAIAEDSARAQHPFVCRAVSRVAF
jgi:ATP-dependent Clp protease adapter protein ClpS